MTPPKVWVGRTLSGVAGFFLLLDCALKVLALAPAIEGTTALGFSADLVRPLGLLQLVCVVAYLVPRTAPVGAVLLTGWLGGAIATHLRLGNPLFSHTLSPLYIAAFVWGGLFLRSERVRALIGPEAR